METSETFTNHVATFLEIARKLENHSVSTGLSFATVDGILLVDFVYLIPRDRIESSNADTASRFDTEEAFNDCHLSLDGTTSLTTNAEFHVKGRVEIIWEDVFHMPTPYLQLWDAANGSPIEWHTFETVQLSREIAREDIVPQLTNHALYKFGTWTIGIHPRTDKPSYTLHICDLERMYQLTDANHRNRPGFLILWYVSKILPTIGLSFPPELFMLFENELFSFK